MYVTILGPECDVIFAIPSQYVFTIRQSQGATNPFVRHYSVGSYRTQMFLFRFLFETKDICFRLIFQSKASCGSILTAIEPSAFRLRRLETNAG
jgi:hypothetical protein